MNCARDGCTGTIVDGYCDVCGMAPARPTPAPTSSRAQRPALTAPRQPPSSALTASTLGSSRRATTGRTRTSARAHLGAGLVEIEPVPFRDPADAVLGAAAVVPESRRFCARCDEPVGRGRDGAPGRTSGFCRKCGTPFSFEPQLARRRRRRRASTRWSAASPTAAWGGSTSPGTATCPTAGSCSRGCSTRATTTRWPPRSPSAASWPRSSTRTS